MNRCGDRPRGSEGPDDLDRLLAGARWPEPRPGWSDRLGSFWRRVRSPLGGDSLPASSCPPCAASDPDGPFISHAGQGSCSPGLTAKPDAPRRTNRRRGLTAAVAVAASLLAVVLIGRAWLPLAERLEPESPSQDATGPLQPAAVPLRVTGQAPTAYEASLFRRLTAAKSPTPRAAEDVLARALAERVKNPAGDLDSLGRPLLARRHAHERELLRRLARCDEKGRIAAIDLLSRVGTPVSVPWLVQLSQYPPTHEAATRALGRLADPRMVSQLIRRETSPNLRRELLGCLLLRRDFDSLCVYLSFVGMPETSRLAAEALAASPRPPVDELLAFFASPRQEERTAAAVVLGRLDNPAVVARLVQMVRRDVHAREALMALAASEEPSALAFLASARRNDALLGLVLAAEHHVQPWREACPPRPRATEDESTDRRTEDFFWRMTAWPSMTKLAFGWNSATGVALRLTHITTLTLGTVEVT